jgi:membrane protein implicated in regulation of membrane protease activity
MIQAAVLLVLFVALVFVGVRWQTERERHRAAETQLKLRVGRRAVVTESVSGKGGLVRINGEAYAACSEDGQPIGPRRLVEVVDVKDFRLVVRKVAGQALLIDVDHIIEKREEAGPGPGSSVLGGD